MYFSLTLFLRTTYEVSPAVPDKIAFSIVGDVAQLPAVGPSQVLADIISSRGAGVDHDDMANIQCGHAPASR